MAKLTLLTPVSGGDHSNHDFNHPLANIEFGAFLKFQPQFPLALSLVVTILTAMVAT